MNNFNSAFSGGQHLSDTYLHSLLAKQCSVDKHNISRIILGLTSPKKILPIFLLNNMRFGGLSYLFKAICLGWERLKVVDMNPTEGLQRSKCWS